MAVRLTLFTRKKMKNTYEEPLHKMAEATRKVSEGDFSVYVPTVHTADKLNYVDVMIMDFNKMVEELGSIETLKTDFVSNVSHEMKTPIAIIKNYAQLLRAGKAAEEQREEYVKGIEDAASRLSSLISNILKLNKLEHQRIMPEVEVYDVCRQLCESAFLFEDAMEEKGIELEDEMIKIHFHTNEPWRVLEYCASLGEIYDIVIEDMDRQSRGLKGQSSVDRVQKSIIGSGGYFSEDVRDVMTIMASGKWSKDLQFI